MRTTTKFLTSTAAAAALLAGTAGPAMAGLPIGPITIDDPLAPDHTAIVGCLASAPTYLQGQLATANIVVGTPGNDDLSDELTAGTDLVCGGKGHDTIDTLGPEDIFLGQDGRDTVITNHGLFRGGNGADTVGEAVDFDGLTDRKTTGNYGIFLGEGGADRVTFNGMTPAGQNVDNTSLAELGGGDDFVLYNEGFVFAGGGNDSAHTNDGLFSGQNGDDFVEYNHLTFDGGAGNDRVYDNLFDAAFLGADGDDRVNRLNLGYVSGGAGRDFVHTNVDTFDGGDGDDHVRVNANAYMHLDGAVFNGGAGSDAVQENFEGASFFGGDGEDDVQHNHGRFDGGADADYVHQTNRGVFNGGDGNDNAAINYGTYHGEAGDDFLGYNEPGATYDGGDGTDTVFENLGTLVNVEIGG